MPTLESLIESKLERLESIPKEFVNSVSKEQVNIYKNVLNKLDALKKKNGVIIVNQQNLKIASDISNELTAILSTGEYKAAVRDFIGEFDKQAEINDGILKDTLEDVIFSDKSALILANYKRIATENLISSSTLTQVLSGPIKNEIEKAVLNGNSIADLTESIRTITIGDPTQLGRLERYANQIAYDGIATTDRAYTKSISEDNGIEFYRYAGGLVRDSRSFCQSRDNKYFHIEEIHKWGSLSPWDGRIKGTNESNIFTNLAGHNCRHSLVPVSLARVPKDVLRRNLSNGNIKLNDNEKEILGL